MIACEMQLFCLDFLMICIKPTYIQIRAFIVRHDNAIIIYALCNELTVFCKRTQAVIF